MSETGLASGWGWEPHFKANDWQEVENWWRDWYVVHPDQPEALGELLDALRASVPFITVENGMERFARHIKLDDALDEWEGREHLRGAAEILALGELEAAAAGDPLPGSEVWSDYRAQIERPLREFTEQVEATEGGDELSRSSHAHEALELLKEIDFVSNAMADEMVDPADQLWLTEVVAEVAYLAFDAGRHMQAAWGKEFERLARTGRKVQNGASTSGKTRRTKTKPKSDAVLKAMRRRVADKGQSVKRAAELTYELDKLGTSPEANRQIWKRDKKARK